MIAPQLSAGILVTLPDDLVLEIGRTPFEQHRLIKSGVRPILLLDTAFGQPFTVDGFSQWMRDAIRAGACRSNASRMGFSRRTDMISWAERLTGKRAGICASGADHTTVIVEGAKRSAEATSIPE